jgi:hypothetical protein
MNYWLWRLSPMVNKKSNPEPYTKPWVFICADRVGIEPLLNKPVMKAIFIDRERHII